jgi:hypothetical protein
MNFSSDLVPADNLLSATSSALSITRSQRNNISDPPPDTTLSVDADAMSPPSDELAIPSPYEMVHLAASDPLTALAVRVNLLPPIYMWTRWEDDAFLVDGHLTTDLIRNHRYVTSSMMFNIADRFAFPVICKAVATDRGIELFGWCGVWSRMSVQELGSVSWLLVPTLHGAVVIELEPAARAEIMEFSSHVDGQYSTYTGDRLQALGRFYRLVLTLNAALAVHGDAHCHDELIEHVFLLTRRSVVRAAGVEFLSQEIQHANHNVTYVTLEFAGLCTTPGAYRYFQDAAIELHRAELIIELCDQFVEPSVFDAQDLADATPSDYDDDDPAHWAELDDYADAMQELELGVGFAEAMDYNAALAA